MITRKHSSRMRTTCFGAHHYMSVPGRGVGPQVNKFEEQVSSDDHQMSIEGVGYPEDRVSGEE